MIVNKCIIAFMLGILFIIVSCGSEPRSTSSATSAEPQIALTATPEPPPPPSPAGIICFSTFDNLYDETAQITLINSDGSGYRVLTAAANAQVTYVNAIIWNPDASEIAFSAKRGGKWGIFSLRTDNTNCIRLTEDSNEPHDLSWSSTGEHIAYALRESTDLFHSTERICVIAADGSESRLVTDGENSSEPLWSEDGQMIYYRVESAEFCGARAIQLDGISVGISTDAADSTHRRLRGVALNLDYNLIKENLRTDGELSIDTPFWSHSRTYLSSYPRFLSSAIVAPNGEYAALLCEMDRVEYFCLVDPITYKATIVEQPGIERIMDDTERQFCWVSNTELLFIGPRQSDYGFCILDVTNGQLDWLLTRRNDERLDDLRAWDYFALD